MKTSKLVLNLEIIYVCSNIRAKHINTTCGQNAEFLDLFVKLQNATISFVMSVCVSVYPQGSTWLPWDGFFFN